MPKRIQIAQHLPIEELEQRYRQAKDGVERSHYQIIWLLAQGRQERRSRPFDRLQPQLDLRTRLGLQPPWP